MTKSRNTDILYLFDRPTEPICVPKGEKQKVFFVVPYEYLPENYDPKTMKDFNDKKDNKPPTKIDVKKISLPDLTKARELKRDEPFSLFIPKHRKIAKELIEIFMKMKTYDDFLSVAVYCRDRMNSNMFIYALAVAILHRPDTKNVDVPLLCEISPEKFFSGRILSKVRETANVMDPSSREPITIPRNYTASDLDEEHRVAYWREDIGINLHHWHWHLVYPIEGTIEIVKKDRRGELFYYMHQQIMARFNTERLCNFLSRVKKLNNFRDPIPEGYFPKINSDLGNRTWASRQSGATLKDINRPGDELEFELLDLERWRDRIYAAIHSNSVITAERPVIQLTEKDGIDILGNLVEASILSKNFDYYGELHNMGHMAISYCHDPDYRYMEEHTVMGENSTAMRDPIFYRWHAYINAIFMEYKYKLPEYSVEQLKFDKVSISELQIVSASPSTPPNYVDTFWTARNINLTRGLDFMPRGPVSVKVNHLNHDEFMYKFTAINNTRYHKTGTVRIFMAPKHDERGMEFRFRVQKDLMIEMDKFEITLKPGKNHIERRSSESSVTVPFQTTFRDLESGRPKSGDLLEESNFCGCGWPEHMLIPKGKMEGFAMDLFVMISDGTDDIVAQEAPTGCTTSVSYCGLRNRKYPDARSMGYPFDRLPRNDVKTLSQFLTSNMATQTITIRFTDDVKERTLISGTKKCVAYTSVQNGVNITRDPKSEKVISDPKTSAVAVPPNGASKNKPDAGNFIDDVMVIKEVEKPNISVSGSAPNNRQQHPIKNHLHDHYDN